METYLKRQGYNYYVYVGPGHIEYYVDRDKAQEYADEIGAEVQEMF